MSALCHLGGHELPGSVQGPRSRADFVSNLGIVEEEVDESLFWLEFLLEANLIDRKRMSDLIGQARQLGAIFGASRRTAKRNNRQSEIGSRKSGTQKL